MEKSANGTIWGFWSTTGLSFCVWTVFVFVQTIVAVAALVLLSIQNPNVGIEALAQDLATNGMVLAIATLVSTPVCIAVIFAFIRLRKGATIPAYLQLGPINRRTFQQLIVWNGLTVVFIYTIDFLKSLLPRAAPPTFTLDIYESAQVLPLLYLAIVVAAPVFEEIFFRGFMFQGFLHSRLGAIGTILVTSGIWAVIHSQYDSYDMAGIFLFGLLLGVAQWRTRCLYVAIAMHAFNNLLALISVASGQG